MLESFGRMVERVLGQDGRKRVSLGNVVARAVKQCLETLRLVVLFFFLTTLAFFFHFQIPFQSFCPYDIFNKRDKTI